MNTHIAVCATGYRRYIEDFYCGVESSSPEVVNMQVRYWVEAVEKFYSLDEKDYDQTVLEEGILVVNNLANSLLYLGGVNYSGRGRVPSLLELFDGKAFPLRESRPDLYAGLTDIDRLYNQLSKHFSLERRELFEELTYEKLQEMLDVATAIWRWVCKQDPNWDEFSPLFYGPMEILKRGYFPSDDEEA